MSSPFDRSAGAVIPFSSVRARDWGVNCQAYDLIDVPARRFTYEQMPSGESEVTHLHDRAHQVFHVLSGTLMVEVEDEVLVAHARDTIEVPAGTPHRALTGRDQGATFILFSTPSTVADRRGVGLTRPHSPQVRRASENDIAELVRLRRLMFDEMGLDTTNRNWEPAAHDIIVREMAADRLAAMVVDSPDGTGDLVASGVVQFEIGLPFPGLESPGRAYISSMSTDRNWRGRGFAREILSGLLAECEARGVEVVGLHATAQARPIYERHGFRARGGSPEMRRIRRTATHD